MWLIEVKTQKLQEFLGGVPPYAILSHRWGPEELNFKEVSKERIDRSKRGYQKLVDACSVAAEHHLHYLWIDTCCIDRKSSAELSEAINSMFAWYKNAEVCLAYLEDVSSDQIDDSFGRSVWFTRAWTLQELLAPRHVLFYNHDWQEIGSKESEAELIEEITGIPDGALLNKTELWEHSFVNKMSWASGRQATRTEDIAYSLLGIFGLYMPLLYGEGERAFVRLQEEIIRSTNEFDFLMWGLNQTTLRLLSSSPDAFQYARHVGCLDFPYNRRFNLTNLGLEIEIDLVRCALGMYAIVLANPVGEPVYLLILRKHRYVRDAYYKVTVITVGSVINNLSKKSNILLMRGTVEQNIEAEERRRYNNYQPIGRSYAVQVRCARSVVLHPVRDQDANDSGIEDAHWSTPKQQNQPYRDRSLGQEILEARWFQPMLLGTLRILCELQKFWTLRAVFFFDFASNPCLLLGLHGHGEHPAGERNPSTLQGISDTYGSVNSMNTHAHGWIQLSAVPIKDETVTFSFVIRGNSSGRTCAKLPPELVPPARSIWVSFVGPSDDQVYSWLLTFSDKAPFDD